MSLDISELFTPTASGVGSNPTLPPADGTWLASLIDVASRVGLPTTAWESGGPELSILQAIAVNLSEVDVTISIMAQGGFLDWAATGSVTFTNTNGIASTQPVTPDPSNPAQNPTGAPGWLDVLGQYVYGVTRLPATYARNVLAIANTTASTIGPFSPGTYHVADGSIGATYANVDSLTVPTSQLAGTAGQVVAALGTSVVTIQTYTAHGLSSGDTVYVSPMFGYSLSHSIATIVVTNSTQFQLVGVTGSGSYIDFGTVYKCTVAPFQADVQGPSGTASPHEISTTVTTNTGVLCDNTVAFVGNAWESNVAYAARCRLKLASLSPNGPAAAYEYVALTAYTTLLAQTPSIQLAGGAITKVIVTANPQTGEVTVTIANDGGAALTLGAPVVEGASNLLVSNALSNAGAVQLEVPSTAGLSANDWATVAGVVGTVEANGTWPISVDDATHITLLGSTYAHSYDSGGVVEAGDIGLVDNLIQQTVVPDTVIAFTQSATAFPIAIAATVVVASSFANNYIALATAAVTQYVAAIPIGGTIIPPASTGVVEWSAVEGTLFAAGIVAGNSSSYVKSIQLLTIDGGGGPVSTDVAFPVATADATLLSLTLTLVRV